VRAVLAQRAGRRQTQPPRAAGNERDAPGKVEPVRHDYITAPTTQGTNSSSPKPNSSLLVFLPDAVSRIAWKIRSPISCTDTSPSMTRPQLMSMSSARRRYMAVLVASFKDGTGLHPNTEPRPVVKQTMLQPPATCPVTEAGS